MFGPFSAASKPLPVPDVLVLLTSVDGLLAEAAG